MMKMRTLVITIAYDDDYIKDPAEWLGEEVHPNQPHHYGVLSIMAPDLHARNVRATTCADLLDQFRPVTVMPTDSIRDIRGNLA